MVSGRANPNPTHCLVLFTWIRESRQLREDAGWGCCEAGEVAMQIAYSMGFSFLWRKVSADSMVAMAVQPWEHLEMVASMIYSFLICYTWQILWAQPLMSRAEPVLLFPRPLLAPLCANSEGATIAVVAGRGSQSTEWEMSRHWPHIGDQTGTSSSCETCEAKLRWNFHFCICGTLNCLINSVSFCLKWDFCYVKSIKQYDL